MKTAATLLLTLFVAAEGGAVESWTPWGPYFKFIDYGPHKSKKETPAMQESLPINDVIQSR